MKITKKQAAKYMLYYQGLLSKKMFSDKIGIEAFLNRVFSIQFDPLNIIACNHELVLHSRIFGFKKEMLYELLYKDRKLVEGYDKNLCIYLTEDWPFLHKNRQIYTNILYNRKEILNIIPFVKDMINKNGAISSNDLKLNERVNFGWNNDSKISKAALELMWRSGEIIICHRDKNKKYYDFTHKYIKDSIIKKEDPNKDIIDYHMWYILRRIGSVGMLWNKASDAYLGICDFKTKERNLAFFNLILNEKILEIEIEGIEEKFYILKEQEKFLIESEASFEDECRIIAPLDNILWDRKLVKKIFDFEYTWEVYKRENERKYGYYVLPVVYGDRFVARFEPVLDLKGDSLIIKNWWWENNIQRSYNMDKKIKKSIEELMEYLKINRIKIDSTLKQDKNVNFI